jgi:hypothetical protein
VAVAVRRTTAAVAVQEDCWQQLQPYLQVQHTQLLLVLAALLYITQVVYLEVVLL